MSEDDIRDLACDIAEEFGSKFQANRFEGTTVDDATIRLTSAEVVELAEIALRAGRALS